MRPVDLPMFSLPIIWREMRSESRRSTTHWLRLLGALVTTGSALLFIANTYPGSAMRGDQLFYVLNRFLFISLWLVGPVLTADCISQEKRDGTLGLLFLTGLTPSGIASGKGTVHLLRGFTFLIAVAPVLSLPLLLGGVSRADLGMALMLNVAALSWGLSAGLIASSFCRDWIRALLLGELLSLCFAGLFTIVHTEILEWIALTYAGGGGIVWAPQGQSPWTTLLLERLWRVPLLDLTPFLLAVNSGGNGWHMDRACWPTIWSTWPPVAQLTWIHAAALLSACSIMSVPASIALAAARIRRSWTDQPASARQLWILDRFCTPRFWRSVFRSRMSRRLDRNPIGWLQQASWQSRLTRWGWCLLVLLTESAWFTDSGLGSVWVGQYWLAYVLLFGIAFTASSSFRLERETGALELLLVTPLRERQLISGRLRGIWSQFLPATIVLGLAWAFLLGSRDLYSTITYSNNRFAENDLLQFLYLPTFFFMPVVGLYLSLRVRNVLAAWLVTLGLGFFLPWTAGGPLALSLFCRLVDAFAPFPMSLDELMGWLADLHLLALPAILLQGVIAWRAWCLLHRRLRARSFMGSQGDVPEIPPTPSPPASSAALKPFRPA